MRLAIFALAAVAPDSTTAQQSRDTVFVEVGSPAIDGRFFKNHAARVRIYRGDTLTAEWVNELTMGDSAGRAVLSLGVLRVPFAVFPSMARRVKAPLLASTQ